MAEEINLNTYKEEKEEERRRFFENKETAAKKTDLVMAMLRAAAEVDKILKKEPLINLV